jgi:hypothetical protein
MEMYRYLYSVLYIHEKRLKNLERLFLSYRRWMKYYLDADVGFMLAVKIIS